MIHRVECRMTEGVRSVGESEFAAATQRSGAFELCTSGRRFARRFDGTVLSKSFLVEATSCTISRLTPHHPTAANILCRGSRIGWIEHSCQARMDTRLSGQRRVGEEC